jgi:uncharacterized protein (DUF697 family)
MEFQEAIILGLAIAALALSILSIVFGIIFFCTQIQQAKRMMKDTSDFTQQMTTLLNEVRIIQNVTGQQIKDQYDKLLDAALHGSGSPVNVAATSAVQVEELGKRLESLEKEVKGLKEPQKVEAQTKAVRAALERLKTTVGQLATHVTEEEREQPRPRPRFEKFTEHARRVLNLAQEEARRFNHDYIGTEHFLLGLLRDKEGVAAKVLTGLGVSLGKIRSAVEFIMGRGEKPSTGEIGLTSRAKRVIELSIDEARRLGHDYIGTEHLLLGLLLEGGGIAASVLDSLGVTLEKARVETIKVLGG